MQKLSRKQVHTIIWGMLLFGLGIGAGWLLNQPTSSVVTQVRNQTPSYPHINPIIYIETPEEHSSSKYTPLKNALNAYVNKTLGDKDATDISIYFRDLNSGKWLGVNETETFDPASMFKVASLIAVYHTAEDFPPFLSAKITVASTTLENTQDYHPPTDLIQINKTYSVEELLDRTITQSDNEADNLLVKYMGENTLASVFDDLHVPLSDHVTPQEYSHLFRVLYNATYLTPVDSEKALALLTKTDFADGLVAGVPAGTQVAHKFGERTTVIEGQPATPKKHELHDCGIVYYPDHPYFICVMTRGDDFPTLAGVIKEVSNITWTNVDKIYSK
jgi:beta-lactamase class A